MKPLRLLGGGMVMAGGVLLMLNEWAVGLALILLGFLAVLRVR